MRYKQPRGSPEADGAKRLMAWMESEGWLCMKLGGGPYTKGWPDYYCYHPIHGHRWIETKAPGGKLRKSQRDRFERMRKAGDKIYVLEDRRHYKKLFDENDNWEQYIRW